MENFAHLSDIELEYDIKLDQEEEPRKNDFQFEELERSYYSTLDDKIEEHLVQMEMREGEDLE